MLLRIIVLWATIGLGLLSLSSESVFAKPKKVWDAPRFSECITHSGLDPLDDMETIESSKCKDKRQQIYTWGTNGNNGIFKGLVGVSAARPKITGGAWQYAVVIAISYERQQVAFGGTEISDDGTGFIRFNRASTLSRGERLDIDVMGDNRIGPECSHASRGLASATTCIYKEAMLIPLNDLLAEATENYQTDALSMREFKLSASGESIRFEIPNALIVSVAAKANSQPKL